MMPSPEAAASLCLSRPYVGTDDLDVSPLLLQDMATGDHYPLLEVVEVDLTERGEGGGERQGKGENG